MSVDVDNGRDGQGAEHQAGLSQGEQADRSADAVAGSRTLSEVAQRLSRLEAQLFPALLLHFGRRTAQHSGKQRSAVRPGAHDQGSNVAKRLFRLGSFSVGFLFVCKLITASGNRTAYKTPTSCKL